MKENMKKKECYNAYGDAILKRCKQHDGCIIILEELQKFVIKAPKEDLNRNEIPKWNYPPTPDPAIRCKGEKPL